MIRADDNKIEMEQIEAKINEVRDKQEFVKQNGKRIREDEMLDKYSIEIDEEDERAKIKRKMA